MKFSTALMFAAGVLMLSPAAIARPSPSFAGAAEPSFVRLDEQITLRHRVFRAMHPKAQILLLHGFPETLHAWDEVARDLSADHDVYVFDWPGFGLSSRPEPKDFSYSPRDYARILKLYIAKAKLDRSRLIVYATDIGALPALLLAIEEPRYARRIVVGDFAPFDRPAYMADRLQLLKSPATAEQARNQFNKARDEILENAFNRGLADDRHFAISSAYRDDLRQGWDHGAITSADAFYHYYSQFTRDQEYLEANLAKLGTPVNVTWGEHDIYISKDMGVEFARTTGSSLKIMQGIGHYPHLQAPQQAADEIRAASNR